MERVVAGLQQRPRRYGEGEADPRLPRGRPRPHVPPSWAAHSRCRR
jgi:hypothetical protein